jgi:YD repeat-containing protein
MRTLSHRDAYGVEDYTDTLTADGYRSRLYRSGVPHEKGCARQLLKYDARGLVQTAACLDVDGRVVLDADGCQVHRFEYDERGRLRAERCFGDDGAPATFRRGGHVHLHEYDARGFRASGSRKEASGAPAVDDAGCATVRQDRDDAGNATLSSCFDEAGRPHGMNGTEAVKTVMTYDANGCVTAEVSEDGRGEPVNVHGVAGRYFKRDASCGVLTLEHRDASGSPAAPMWKAPFIEYQRNAEGLVVEETCRDKAKRAANCRDVTGADGAVLRYTYDERGRETSVTGYDEAGTPTRINRDYPHEWRSSYGADGMRTELAYFDEHGQPALALNTVAKHVFTYDRLGSMTSVKGLDVAGEATHPSTNCSELRRTYDAMHRLASIECRGPAGQLAASDLILEGILWAMWSARVVVERSGASVANVYYGLNGEVMKRVACGAEKCFR